MRIESNVDRTALQSTNRSAPVAKPPPTAGASIEASKQVQNRAILSTSLSVSLSAGNNALGLLYKTAIANLNEVLAPEFGDNAIQTTFDSGLDVSPEATAGRIVALSTGFFERYRESNPDKDVATALKDFTELIGGGIEQGFADARRILDGLGVLGGDIAGNIDRTYELVQSGLKTFADSYAEPPDSESANASASNPATVKP